MAENKNKEFASQQKQPADDSAVEAKLKAQEKGYLKPVAQASEIDSLTPEAGPDVGEKQVQKRIDAENEAGLRGVEVDPTPNKNYTVEGVVKGAPTPETDQSVRPDIVKARKLDGPEPLR